MHARYQHSASPTDQTRPVPCVLPTHKRLTSSPLDEVVLQLLHMLLKPSVQALILLPPSLSPPSPPDSSTIPSSSLEYVCSVALALAVASPAVLVVDDETVERLHDSTELNFPSTPADAFSLASSPRAESPAAAPGSSDLSLLSIIATHLINPLGPMWRGVVISSFKGCGGGLAVSIQTGDQEVPGSNPR